MILVNERSLLSRISMSEAMAEHQSRRDALERMTWTEPLPVAPPQKLSRWLVGAFVVAMILHSSIGLIITFTWIMLKRMKQARELRQAYPSRTIKRHWLTGAPYLS